MESLSLEQLSFRYDDKLILDGLDLYVKKGEFVSIIGPSGCGKSTLFRLITGLEKLQQGMIRKEYEFVGYMPQRDALMPWRTILKNTTLPLECKKVSKADATAKSMALLKQFGLDHYANNYPRDLSGGMKQRVSFIRALNASEDILLLDEPFSALDALTKIELQDWLYNQAKSLNKTILFITHDVDEALYLSDRIYTVTETPIQQMHETVVPLEHPRIRENLGSEEIQKLKIDLLHLLQKGRS
ncbi:ABC transporter ATP-binding protein [Kurthia zopfii]|uniref:Bicarbonate transport ATP-binding protein CmpD n=1 Tax=Kurthia zopfii TaxID=1650 RepID=A0A2U3AB43_9BACL|nr:ABC transporter ATP-binding protein [Kurthia zopfii]PWI21747.1 ABC transporter ATP-binding protein [Kurthia zopfii]TDR35811.1 putative hydroxymethylpyrimidine transport system ATP-binding protein [Kurthia zopfii]STX09715.1 Bicarbonate transport ATP-binding protein CmpD [Kurthia zopfii]VEI06973.1 Bicarbonate transport ATP-binding protein CmpD [Kurthia zopfii]GEK31120.1 ABC transporter ATP-binding protein [Kurthia zopfii]